MGLEPSRQQQIEQDSGTTIADRRGGGTDEREEKAIYSSHIKTSNIAELPSFQALLATGRLHIINDEELRAMLVQFTQRREAVQSYIDLGGEELGSGHPELFALELFVNTADGRNDLDANIGCDLDAMRRSPKFLHELFGNADLYDAYMVSGLLPIVETVDALHSLLDRNLNIDHE